MRWTSSMAPLPLCRRHLPPIASGPPSSGRPRATRGARVSGRPMPISYRIDSDGSVVHVTFRGRVTIAEFRAHRAALTSDPAFRISMHRLTDVRELAELPSMDDLRD